MSVDISILRQITTALKIFSKMAACKFGIIARSFSSSAVQNQMVKTPVPVFGISGRYASALYSAAVKAKDIDKIEGDLVKFQNALTSDKKFRQVMKDPTFKKNIKANVIEEASKKLSLSQSSTNFLKLIAENGRLKDFDSILNNLKAVMAAHRGEIPCEIVSARPLSAEEKKEIEDALKKFTKKNEAILLNLKVDPTILGGLIVSVGDKYVDMSFASKIRKYTKILEGVM